jgi:hypothetical protein
MFPGARLLLRPRPIERNGTQAKTLRRADPCSIEAVERVSGSGSSTKLEAMKKRSLIAIVLITLAVVGPRVHAALSVPLTIQEALYPGSMSGLARTGDPVTVGIPLPDDPATGVTDVSQLTLTGAPAGQFRALGRWPSGRIKWVLVDTLASLSGGGTATGIALSTGGNGNFGGASLATDNGATITVSTGTATFTIRKANFNGFDQVAVGGTIVVPSGSSSGLVITGPAPGATTCGVCTTIYSSANDSSSTAVIEENGPVRTVIRASGAHKDASGNAYLKFTVRMHFYKNKSYVKAVTSLRNADNGASGSAEVAYKGLKAYEWRTAANVAGTQTYSIAKHDGAVETGTISGSDEVYLYQGKSELMEETNWDTVVPQYTNDTGYAIKKNGATLASGSNVQYPEGWADIRTSSGAGMSIGVYQMAAYWPKSLEFGAGGSDVRIGIWPRQNSRTFHQAWPQWSTHDLFFNFHGAALPSPSGDFLKFQHYLVGHADYTHYNSTGVFGMFKMASPAVEQSFYQDTASAAVPSISQSGAWPYRDKGISDINWKLVIHRWKDWGEPGGGNQMEFGFSGLQNFITRGMTGRYLYAAQFYRYITDDVFPHSDGFTWNNQTGLDSFGRPNRTSPNSSEGVRSWIDTLHPHWYGMTDYYFMTGDELVKEQLLDGVRDYYTATNTYPTSGLLSTTRAVGTHLIGASRFAMFLKTIGETADEATVLTNATTLYNLQVKPKLCPESDEAGSGCTFTSNPAMYHEDSQFGTSPLRGVHWSGGFIANWCGTSGNIYRSFSSFNGALLVHGILELRNAKGSGWTDSLNALDLAYGVSQAALSEAYVDGGNGRWDNSGFRPATLLDMPSACGMAEQNYDPSVIFTQWMHFYVQYLETGQTTTWKPKLRTAVQKGMAALNTFWHEFGNYQLSTLADILNTSSAPTLQNVTLTNVTANGGGSYTISWTVPAGATSYRVKWGPKQIVDWLGFNAGTYTFTGNPTTQMNWFAATNVASTPTPGAAGSTQSMTISTGASGLTAANFSVKAYVSGGSTTPPPPSGTASNLLLVSGNNQTGAAGGALPAPLTVKVTDASGNPVSGINVTFVVTGGGGSLSASQVATNSSGLAFTTLTLGSSVGTNTVVASSSSLTGSPIIFTAMGTSSTEQPAVSINPNQWTNVTPTYQGAPNGGYLAPFTFNNMGVYDPASKRTISADRWYDPVHSMSIYANSLMAYDPGNNTVTVLKVSNWKEGYMPLPENSTEPTPIDRHPLGGLALDPNNGTIYLVNGLNQAGRAYYPDHPNDTWRFNISGRSWTKMADAAVDVHPPSDGATYSGMVFDLPSGKLVYFAVDWSKGTTTWLFDPRTNKWSSVPQDASAKNVFISIAGIAYDSARNRVLAFGGGMSSVADPSTQLWAYSVSQNKWTALASSPVPAAAPEFAYDSVHDIFLALAETTTLVYNPRTNAWSILAARINRAANMNRQNVTYNPAFDVFVFEGGSLDNPVWSLFRYSDSGSPPLTAPNAPTNLRIIK